MERMFAYGKEKTRGSALSGSSADDGGMPGRRKDAESGRGAAGTGK